MQEKAYFWCRFLMLNNCSQRVSGYSRKDETGAKCGMCEARFGNP